MRTPREYVAQDGTITYRVRFRYRGKSTSETFDDTKQAGQFAKELDALGADEALKRLHERSGTADEAGHTVDDVWAMYLAYLADEVESDRTIADYNRDFKNYVQPVFGKMDVDDVDEKLVQGWVDTLRTGLDWIRSSGKKPSPFRKLAAKTVHDRHALLSAMYKWAIHPGRGYAKRNPCAGSKLPKRKKGQPKGLRPAEWQALAPALRKIDSAAADLAEFLLASAWRFSEATALDAMQVEDYGTEMYVNMARVVRRNAKSQNVIVEDAKSEAGLDRRIKIDPEAADMIRARIEKIGGQGLVFTNKHGNKWHNSNFRDRAWDPAVSAAKLAREPTPHWLRHTHVGWLILGRKVNLVEIQRRVGHASLETTTGVYGRMVDDISDEALDAFAEFRRATLKLVPAPVVQGEVEDGQADDARAGSGTRPDSNG